MYSLKELLNYTMEKGASDLHLTAGIPPVMRINGDLIRIGEENLKPSDTIIFVKEILGDEFNKYAEWGEYDTSYSISDKGRFRISAFKQRDTDALAIRTISAKIPGLNDLKHPEIIRALSEKRRGLVLVTGPTGSGKSTTLAAMINEINNSRKKHIITLEDPIEYIHCHNLSIVSQREIGRDSHSYSNALKSVLREDPDVILIGEMRDLESIATAVTAAETGHLVFSSLHTTGAAKTIDRIVDVFPPHQQQQVKTQLAAVLQGIISQQLIPKADKSGRVAALEIMVNTPGIQNLIREGKTHQIESLIQTGKKYGMKTMDMYLVDLVKDGVITIDTALRYSFDRETIKRTLY
ncbi:MAG: type IV pilus twitching motility protein PilT [Clostridiaceae bacterium]